MITLIKNANVYAPLPMGINDILICDGRIAAIEPDITLSGKHVTTVNANGLLALPGLVDALVHITGGGGEGGFHTRTPQMSLTDASLSGVTTVIGALGTDATTRSLPDLIAKCRALDSEGISAYCYSGSYQLPIRTYTGNLTDDIVMLDKIIGVGEVAIADHRASHATVSELVRVASDARVGGMLSGKAGIVSIHTGDHETCLSMLHQAVSESAIPPTQFYPTHINRSQHLLDEGIKWADAGGFIDMTTSTNAQFIAEGEIPAADAVAYCFSRGVCASQVTMSSDGNASLPVFNEQGELVGLEVGKVGSLHTSLAGLINLPDVTLQDAIATVTSTPASILKLKQKGQLAPHNDADILLCEPGSLALSHVYAKGQLLCHQGKALVKGTFE
ncbi:beta-aspartyl-peptidase [Alteromonas sediminis]|uniref:Isoaspartyl dipeptidase n=1 Tax=Alteromonas sediminis TaxID=2259342 RepID=A0A3N5XYZ0_9ALTE|nr:beta-aspartyl-peptidase [Alteromonas sediminis]RPJ65900.1 beta-aspartyl-peptidase [Alteromonas sediminis]